MPGTTKSFAMTWDKHYPFGKYTAESTITYSPDDIKIAPPPVTFWVIPWMAILGILMPSLIILFFVIRTRKRWKSAWVALTGNKIEPLTDRKE